MQAVVRESAWTIILSWKLVAIDKEVILEIMELSVSIRKICAIQIDGQRKLSVKFSAVAIRTATIFRCNSSMIKTEIMCSSGVGVALLAGVSDAKDFHGQ